MLRRFVLFGILAAGLSIAAAGCGELASIEDAPLATATPADNLPVAPPPRTKRKVAEGTFYSGVVTRVGEDWFELAAGWEGGVTGRRKPDPEDHEFPKVLSVAGTRPGGKLDGEGSVQTHLVTHLKVGDKVSVESRISRSGEEWVVEIQIYRRPGGKIPPYFGDSFAGSKYAAHLREQAYQDWEEKGIPIPAQYLSDGRAKSTNPPYPPEAPMPREIGPRISQ